MRSQKYSCSWLGKRFFCLVLVWLSLLTVAAAQASEAGKISGKVFDKGSQKPLMEAGVELIDEKAPAGAPGKFGLTNSQGFFILTVNPGTYTLRVTYPNYQAATVKGVIIEAGKTVSRNVSIEPALVEIDEMRVVARPRGDVELVQLMKRKAASNIMDNISAETISKIPESDVAGILTRMPGVTIHDGKYLQARGMPKRYNRSSLNGAVLPTTKPNEKVVPLNLFPSGVVESINVAKSYSPDLPGNFSGGLAQIQTKSIPDRFMFKFSTGTEYNSVTTNEDFLTYRGSSTDWLGWDDGDRDLPGKVPPDKVTERGRFSKIGYDKYFIEEVGEAFENNWKTYRKSAPFDQNFNFLVGNRFNRFGILFNAGYKLDYENRDKEQMNIYSVQQDGTLNVEKSYDFQRSTHKAQLNGLLNMGFEINPDHILYFNNFYNHTGEDETSFYQGYNSDIGVNINDTRLRWVEEEIYSGQLGGDHLFYLFFDHKIEWTYTYSMAEMTEPDLREYMYEYNPNTEKFLLADESMSGFRMWTEQEEDIKDAALNWTVSFDQWFGLTSKFKFGGAYLKRDREFWSRRFRYMPENTKRIDLSAPIEEIFAPQNINQYEYHLEETTRATDTYDADQEITAGYFMLDLPITEWLRITGGFRFEHSEINVTTVNLFKRGEIIKTEIEGDDWFPSVNLTFTPMADMNIRLGYSETVSRPEFHELSPFEFTDVRGGRNIKGNPDLSVTEIKNYDFRWEWYLNESDIIALSVFYKDFTDAIERTIQPTIELRTSYVNADQAELFGVEFELRKNLGFLSPLLSHWNVIGNYIFSDSESEVEPKPGFVPTNTTRKMVGQADHTYNLTIEYDNKNWGLTARLMFQHISDRIYEVGGLGLPDILEEDRTQLDFVLIKKFWEHYEFKLICNNLTNEEVLFTQGGNLFHKYKEGVSWKFKLSYKW